jgi:hypothetical protein
MPNNDEDTRITLRLGPKAMETLRWLQRKRGVSSMTDVFRHALSTEKFLYERQDAGEDIILENRDTKAQRILALG